MNSSKEKKILPASKCCLILAFDSLNEWFEEIKIRVWERFFFQLHQIVKFHRKCLRKWLKREKNYPKFQKIAVFLTISFFFMNKTCFLAPGFKSTKITWLYPLIYTFEEKNLLRNYVKKGAVFIRERILYKNSSQMCC